MENPQLLSIGNERGLLLVSKDEVKRVKKKESMILKSHRQFLVKKRFEHTMA